MLVDELPESAPEVTILHNQQVVAPSNQFIPNVRLGPVAVFRTLFIDNLLHEPSVSYDDGGAGSHLEGVQPAVLLGPFRESASTLVS